MNSPTYHKDGFIFFKSLPTIDTYLGDNLLIEGGKIDKTINYMNREGIRGLTINPSSIQIDHLDFIKDLPLLERLVILKDKVDPTQLSQLKKLKALGLTQVTKPLDFQNFPEMEVLGINYNKNVVNLNSCKKIISLGLTNYDKDDLDEISELENLKLLNLYKTKVITLYGAGKLSLLTEIHIDAAKRLISLDGINENNKHLIFIDVFNAPNLINYKALDAVTSLEKIRFAKTGEAESISFIKQQSKLKMAAIGMKVTDGDVKYLLSVPEAFLMDFPHNNISSKQLKN